MVEPQSSSKWEPVPYSQNPCVFSAARVSVVSQVTLEAALVLTPIQQQIVLDFYLRFYLIVIQEAMIFFCKIQSCNSIDIPWTRICFYCTTLRDVIRVKRCFICVISMTCILHHAVVCWVTAAGIRANALTLGLKSFKGDPQVEQCLQVVILSKPILFYDLTWMFT